MSPYPKEFVALARKAAEKFPNSVESAVEWLERKMELDAELLATCDLMFRRSAYREAIHGVRHSDNRELMESARSTAGPAKVTRGAAADAATQNWLGMNFAGKTLGKIYGRDLGELADNELRTGEGYVVRARILRALKPIVPDDKLVEECVTNERVHAIAIEAKGVFHAVAEKMETTPVAANGGAANGNGKHHRVAAAKA